MPDGYFMRRRGRPTITGAPMLTIQVNPKLLELLVCPVTKTTLSYDAEKQELISALTDEHGYFKLKFKTTRNSIFIEFESGFSRINLLCFSKIKIRFDIRQSKTTILFDQEFFKSKEMKNNYANICLRKIHKTIKFKISILKKRHFF